MIENHSFRQKIAFHYRVPNSSIAFHLINSGISFDISSLLQYIQINIPVFCSTYKLRDPYKLTNKLSLVFQTW